MSDLDYFKGQWEEFRKWEAEEHKEIRTDLKEIKEKMSLLAVKVAVIGGTVSLVVVLLKDAVF